MKHQLHVTGETFTLFGSAYSIDFVRSYIAENELDEDDKFLEDRVVLQTVNPATIPLLPAAGTVEAGKVDILSVGLDADKIEAADYTIPIIAVVEEDEEGVQGGLVIDGWHRLYKARRDGITEVPVYIVDYQGVLEWAAQVIRTCAGMRTVVRDFTDDNP